MVSKDLKASFKESENRKQNGSEMSYDSTIAANQELQSESQDAEEAKFVLDGDFNADDRTTSQINVNDEDSNNDVLQSSYNMPELLSYHNSAQ